MSASSVSHRAPADHEESEIPKSQEVKRSVPDSRAGREQHPALVNFGNKQSELWITPPRLRLAFQSRGEPSNHLASPGGVIDLDKLFNVI